MINMMRVETLISIIILMNLNKMLTDIIYVVGEANVDSFPVSICFSNFCFANVCIMLLYI